MLGFPAFSPWRGQKPPSVVETVTSTVLSGVSTTGIGAGRASTSSGGQSRVRPVELVLVQANPSFWPLSQVPVPGLAGVPVPEHLGHKISPVTNVFDESEMLRFASPVARVTEIWNHSFAAKEELKRRLKEGA